MKIEHHGSQRSDSSLIAKEMRLAKRRENQQEKVREVNSALQKNGLEETNIIV